MEGEKSDNHATALDSEEISLDLSNVSLPTPQAESSSTTPSGASQTSCNNRTTFVIDWDNPSIKCDGKGGLSVSKGDFAIKLEMLIEAKAKTGYLSTVTRAIDCKERKCFFTIESTSFKSRFMQQINNSFGSGGMSLSLNEAQFSQFIQFLKDDVVTQLPIQTAACRIGMQDVTPPIWVMSETLQINADGEAIRDDDRKFFWHQESLVENLGNIRINEVLPKITLPLDTSVLSRMVELLEITMGHNFYSSLLVASGIALCVHYPTLASSSSGFKCPIVIADGNPETGKSKSIQTALSMIGVGKDSILEGFTNTYILERASISTIPFAIDDPSEKPTKSSDLNELIADLYNQGSSGSMRKGSITPVSCPLIATNYSVSKGERIQSRVCVVPFNSPSIAPRTEEAQDYFDELDDMLFDGRFSASCGWVIKMGKMLNDRQNIREVLREFRPHFDGRRARNWAMLAFCVKQLLIESKRENQVKDVFDYIKSIGSSTGHTQHTCNGETSSNTIVQETIKEILELVLEKSRTEILQFLRIDLLVESRQVVSVVLNDVAGNLNNPVHTIRRAIVSGNMGKTHVTKDFLHPCSEACSVVISRGVNNYRRKCDVVFLDMILPETVEKLRKVFQDNSSMVDPLDDATTSQDTVVEITSQEDMVVETPSCDVQISRIDAAVEENNVINELPAVISPSGNRKRRKPAHEQLQDDLSAFYEPARTRRKKK